LSSLTQQVLRAGVIVAAVDAAEARTADGVGCGDPSQRVPIANMNKPRPS